jgi:hypothetical protein
LPRKDHGLPFACLLDAQQDTGEVVIPDLVNSVIFIERKSILRSITTNRVTQYYTGRPHSAPVQAYRTHHPIDQQRYRYTDIACRTISKS